MVDECLDDLALLELVDGSLADSRLAAAETHLAECATCRQAVALLVKGRGSQTAGADPERSSTPLVLLPGAEVGRYEVIECIGAGGMGVVYAARDPKLGRRVALKVVRSGKPSAHDRLLREAQAMARLAHPNVVTVYDVIAHESEVVVAMELVPGTTLARWLQTADREWTAIVDVFVQAGRGLAAAHAAGIVHRDFKPSNVFVRDDGRVQVGDFGLARLIDPPLIGPTASTAGESIRMVVGTPRYMAPEQRTAGRADERSDQYSFAIALREAVHGAPDGATPLTGATASTDDEATRAPTTQVTGPRTASVPAALDRVIARATSSKAAGRYPSITALVGELERLRGRGRSRRAVWLAGGALAVAIGAYSVTRSSDEPPPPGPTPAVAMLPFVDRTGQAQLEFTRAGLPRLLGSELSHAGVPVIGYYELRDRGPVLDAADVIAWRDRARTAGAGFTVSGTLAGDAQSIVVAIVLARVDGIPVRVVTARGAPSTIPSVVGAQAAQITSAATGRTTVARQAPRDLAIERDLTLAIEAFQQLHFEQARTLLDNVVRQEPARAEALYYLALIAWWHNEPKQVFDAACQRALAGDLVPEQRGVLTAITALVANDFDRAIAELRALDERFPTSSQVRYTLSEALFHGGYPAEGMTVFRLLVEEVPGWHLALMHPLTYYSVHGDDEGMTWALGRLPLLDALTVKVWKIRRLIMRGEYREARAALDRDPDPNLVYESAMIAFVENDRKTLDAITAPRVRLAVALWRGDRDAARPLLAVETALEDRKLRYNLVLLAPMIAIAGDRDLVEQHLAALTRAAGTERPSIGEQLARLFLLAALDRRQDIATPSTIPEVDAVARALTANLGGDPAVALWKRAADLSSDGQFILAGRYFLARTQAAAGDHKGVLDTCAKILAPRHLDLSIAPAIPPCLRWSAAAHDALGEPTKSAALRAKLP